MTMDRHLEAVPDPRGTAEAPNCVECGKPAPPYAERCVVCVDKLHPKFKEPKPCPECGGSASPADWGHKNACSFWDEVRAPKPGDKYDQGKPRWDLLPILALEEIVLVLTFGANKYKAEGWREVPNARRRYFAAALRHLVAWFFKGEKRDPESGLHHLAHAACCIMFMLELDA